MVLLQVLNTAKMLGSLPNFKLLMLDTENKFVSTGAPFCMGRAGTLLSLRRWKSVQRMRWWGVRRRLRSGAPSCVVTLHALPWLWVRPDGTSKGIASGVRNTSVPRVFSDQHGASFAGVAKEIAAAARGKYHYIPKASDKAIGRVASQAISELKR